MLSPAARPSDSRHWAEDRRRLGAAVRRISVDDGRTLALDGPAPLSGWHPIEAGPMRWTGPEATLALPSDATMLELRVAG